MITKVKKALITKGRDLCIPEGTEVNLIWKDKEKPSRVCVVHNGVEYSCTEKIFACLDIEAPSLEQLERWTFDGVCESVAGNTVEPDGWDHEDTPSWLLVMGMI